MVAIALSGLIAHMNAVTSGSLEGTKILRTAIYSDNYNYNHPGGWNTLFLYEQEQPGIILIMSNI